jgi:hypothetical protein
MRTDIDGGNRAMVDPGSILEPTMKEAQRVLEEMRKTQDLDQRKDQSEILRNLCQSAGVFFNLMTDAMLTDDMMDIDDTDPFDEDD